MEWKELQTLVKRKIGYGIVQPGPSVQRGVPIIKVNNIISGLYDTEYLDKTTVENDAKYQRTKLKGGELIVTVVGTCGKTAIVPPHFAGCNLVRATCLIDIEDETICRWIKYYIDSPQGQAYINRNLNTTVQATLNVKNLNEMPIPFYSKEYTSNVVKILSSLDRKIELNNKINADLEEMAQAIFKNWFVDFEPFKDGKFVDSELGMIPEGWKVSQIADIPHILETGKRPKGGAVEKGIPSVGAEHVKGMCAYDYSKTKYINCEFAAKLKTGKINGYELMIYKDGGKPGYFIPNFSIFGEGYPFENCYLNEHVFKLDFDGNKEFNIFCYFFFKTEQIMSYFNAQGAKAAIPGINKKDVENIYIFSPDNESVIKFGEFAYPLFKQMLKNAIENRTLSTLRDTLLPRLMSGELEVPE